MRTYITEVSKEDFQKINPSYSLDLSSSSLPKVVALISEDYPSLPNHIVDHIEIPQAKHIYSTRDYWEVTTINETTRNKIPKRYTTAIYLIRED